jgi:hypothetical protein
MNKYLIERTLPGAGKLSPSDLTAISAKSNAVIRELQPDLQWINSYVVEDKIYCVYTASGPEIIRKHARCGGFPVDEIMLVNTVIGPSTGEER